MKVPACFHLSEPAILVSSTQSAIRQAAEGHRGVSKRVGVQSFKSFLKEALKDDPHLALRSFHSNGGVDGLNLAEGIG